MLILPSQDLFFSALSKHVLCNAHLVFPRPKSKHNKTKLLLLVQDILLAPSPRPRFAAVPSAALTDDSTNAPKQRARSTRSFLGRAFKPPRAVSQLRGGRVSTQ